MLLMTGLVWKSQVGCEPKMAGEYPESAVETSKLARVIPDGETPGVQWAYLFSFYNYETETPMHVYLQK